ncbi:MAG: hypothetical protein JXB00_06190 [Bacteroidales bacterium]|nr:hypothetical protein [Bacteroidales bacterium]
MLVETFTLKQSLSLKLFAILVLIIPLSLNADAQEGYGEFRLESTRTNKTGMIVLGSWALANMATGAYGWSKNSGDNKYFHQMNFFWNTVNLSIASVALYNLYTTDFISMGQDEFLTRQLKLEKTLLINSFLDVGYIGTGFLLKHFSEKSSGRKDLLKGYGNSLLLQGGFLLVFDVVLYGIFRAERMDFLQSAGITAIEDGIILNIALKL